MSVLLLLRNTFFPHEVYSIYSADGTWAEIIRINTVVCRCAGARVSALESDKSLARMIYYNLIRNVPNTVFRHLMYKGRVNFDSVFYVCMLSTGVTIVL